jgi:predicted O-methyltransferase YrrM
LALRSRLATPLHWIRGVLREREFRTVPRVAADPGALGTLGLSPLAAMLRPDAVLVPWTEDHRALEALALPEMTGGVNPGDQRALHALVLGLGPRAILEVGTHVGCSTVSLALAARRVGARIVTCDIADVNDEVRKPWLQYGSRRSPRQLIEAAGCSAQVEFQVSDSLTFLDHVVAQFDLIFLDGDHAAATVYRELPAAFRALRPGGYVVLHDYYPDNRPLFAHDSAIAGPFLAVKRLRDEGVAFSVQPLGTLEWRTRVGSTVTSLALVSRGP